MTQMTFLLEAEEEMNFSAQFYNQKVSGLGLDFLEEIERSIRDIEENPQGLPQYEDNIRKYNIRRFPFSLYYIFEQKADKIIILAIAHQKRKPGYWKNRL